MHFKSSKYNSTFLRFYNLPAEDRSKHLLLYKEVFSSSNNLKITFILISITSQSCKCIFNHLKYKIRTISQINKYFKAMTINKYKAINLLDLVNRKRLMIIKMRISNAIKIKLNKKRTNKMKRHRLIICQYKNIDRANK